MIVSVHRDADAELLAAAVFYAEHASRQVAESFLDEFEWPRWPERRSWS